MPSARFLFTVFLAPTLQIAPPSTLGWIRPWFNSLVDLRLLTMSPLYPCGKPCSRGTHNETVKNPALSPTFDRSNQDHTTAVALFNGHSTERACGENHVKQTFNQRTWYKSDEGSSVYLVSPKLVPRRYIFYVFKTKTNQRNLQLSAVATSSKIWSTASFELKSR